MTGRLPLMVLAAFAALGGGAFAMHKVSSTSSDAELGLSVSPGLQAAGSSRVSFGVTVRSGGVSRLSARVPRRARADFRLADGSRTPVVPAGDIGATLTVRLPRDARPGRRRIVVRAAAGGRTATRVVWLDVLPRSRRHFHLAAQPAHASTRPGRVTRFRIRARRARGFTRRVALGLSGIPRGWTASWSRKTLSGRNAVAELRVRPASDRAASGPIVVRGLSRVQGRRVLRHTVVALHIQPELHSRPERGLPFQISGNLGPRLYPGRGVPLDLTLTNPNSTAISVTALSVGLDDSTSAPGCDGHDNFDVRQYSGKLPLLLRPGTARLSALVPDRSAWPRIRMRYLAVNQDACKSARIRLRFGGKARG